MTIRILKVINIPFLVIVIFTLFFNDRYIEAHKPFFPDPAPTIADLILISNPNVSQVFYFILDKDSKEFWIKMNLQKGHNLILDLGAPKLPSLKNASPELYLYHQIAEEKFSEIYLSNLDLKNTVSEFHEPFTDTYSWIYLKKKYIIKEKGNYFVRIKSSQNIQTKTWFATGIIEDFQITDLINFAGTRSDVKDFHNPTEIIESENGTIIAESNNKITNLNIYFIIVIVSTIIIMIFFIKYKSK